MRIQMVRSALLSSFLGMLCFGCVAQTAADRESSMLADPPAFESMTYLAPWAKTEMVTLENGQYREPVLAGAASVRVVRLSNWQAVGRVDGQPTGVVILVMSAGGSGTFYHLALMIHGQDGWVNSDLVLLGDRVKVRGLALDDEGVLVTMTMHGPSDPMCCPTLQARKRFVVSKGVFGETADGLEKAELGQVVGPVWKWVGTLYNDDRKVAPERPEEYTIRFAPDGTLDVRADCNRKGGEYLLGQRRLSSDLTHSTMAACPEGSLEDAFAKALFQGNGWFIKKGELYVDLKYDSGTMHFVK